MYYDDEKERREAYYAGQEALRSLERARDALKSARNWGIYDMLGGGLISSWIKHDRMNEASGYIEDAKRQLRRFGHELDDVQGYGNIDLDTGDFWGISDWLFDGLLSDWIMQDRINDARAQLDRAIIRVKSILDRLR